MWGVRGVGVQSPPGAWSYTVNAAHYKSDKLCPLIGRLCFYIILVAIPSVLISVCWINKSEPTGVYRITAAA